MCANRSLIFCIVIKLCVEDICTKDMVLFYPIMMKRNSALGEQIPSTEIWIAIPTITSSITREYTADQKAAELQLKLQRQMYTKRVQMEVEEFPLGILTDLGKHVSFNQKIQLLIQSYPQLCPLKTGHNKAVV